MDTTEVVQLARSRSASAWRGAQPGCLLAIPASLINGCAATSR